MIRPAQDSDLVGLLDLERAANLVALAHIFPVDRFPYPAQDVLARWAIVLADPACSTLVIDREDGGGLDALVAHDQSTIRHLAVHPDRWGQGLAGRLLDGACARIDGPVGLKCLVENHRARGLYEHLGWRPTGLVQESEFPPYPMEMEYLLSRGES